nr:tRNA-uridine 2-sulfurtransferase [Candidatus Cloacimonadota bacterium]
MIKDKSSHAAIALFSGGLDSLLAVKWMQKAGYKVYPVYFLTPYMPSERALESAAANGIKLIVRDISREHLEMMKNPSSGFGKYLNPCIDCHALMFRIAGEMMPEIGADYLISGEVLGQRPMSQRLDAMNRVGNLSGYRNLLVRPLSQKHLRATTPILEGWVDIDDMLDISGRGRYRQLELAKMLGIKDYPTPAGGCLLTDKNYSIRLRDLMINNQIDLQNIELLKYGRHFRLDNNSKVIIGRDEVENKILDSNSQHLIKFKARDYTGPLGLLTNVSPTPAILSKALNLFWYYHKKAPASGIVQLTMPNGGIKEHLAIKADIETVESLRLSQDK